jgi:hypothetical protein
MGCFEYGHTVGVALNAEDLLTSRGAVSFSRKILLVIWH